LAIQNINEGCFAAGVLLVACVKNLNNMVALFTIQNK